MVEAVSQITQQSNNFDVVNFYKLSANVLVKLEFRHGIRLVPWEVRIGHRAVCHLVRGV